MKKITVWNRYRLEEDVFVKVSSPGYLVDIDHPLTFAVTKRPELRNKTIWGSNQWRVVCIETGGRLIKYGQRTRIEAIAEFYSYCMKFPYIISAEKLMRGIAQLSLAIEYKEYLREPTSKR